jgi:hypothetical protein
MAKSLKPRKPHKQNFPCPGRQNRTREDGRLNNPGSARHLLARIREERTLDLRLAGKSYAEIGRELGVTDVCAYQAAMRVLDRFNSELKEKAPQARRVELERCRKLLSYAWKDAQAGEPKSILAALKISERIARLLGLDAPTKIAGMGEDGAITVEVFRKMLDEPVTPDPSTDEEA